MGCEEEGEVLHKNLPQLVVLDVILGGCLAADANEDAGLWLDHGVGDGSVGGAGVVGGSAVGKTGGAVGEASLAQEGNHNVNDFIAEHVPVMSDGGVAELEDLGVGLVEPRAVYADGLLGARGGRGGRGKAALGIAGTIGLGDCAVRGGEIGYCRSHGAHDAHAMGHDARAVVGGLEAVLAGKGGGHAGTTASIGADSNGDDAG